MPYTIFKATWMMDALPMFIKGNRALVIGGQSHPVRWLAADDFARLVSRAFQTPEAADKTLFVFGPQALTKPQALGIYLASVRPDVKLTFLPLRMMKFIAGLSVNRQFRSDVARMAFYDTIGDDFGDDTAANTLLGESVTTLAEWSQGRR